MAERHERVEKAVLLVGAGRRAREAGAVLAALATIDEAVEGGAAPIPLADLEELLGQRAREGVLILEAGAVPAEDIGFVRRFLERHPAWRLVVEGDDATEPRTRALLALPRAERLAWPPDLERPRALLPRARPAGSRASAAESPRRRASAAAARARPLRAAAAVDLGDLLEEGARRVRCAARHGALPAQPGPARSLRAERGSLLAGLQGLVELARVCAGRTGSCAALNGTARRS
jgi:hypothetical protein